MNRRYSTICVVGLCGVTAAALLSWQRPMTADDKPDPSTASDRDRWMAVKLTSAQQILEHLTSGDFAQLECSTSSNNGSAMPTSPKSRTIRDNSTRSSLPRRS